MKNLWKNVLGLILLALVALRPGVGVLSAQTPQLEWLRQYTAICQGDDREAFTAADAQGNTYVAGTIGGNLPGYEKIGSYYHPYFDVFVRKYDLLGNELWTRVFGTEEEDHARCVAVDETGVYVVGFTFGILPGQTKIGSRDSFIRKYDTDGNEIWTRQFGASSVAETRAVMAIASGIYIAGEAIGTFPGQPSPPQQSSWYAFLCKYDADGNEIWTLPSFSYQGVYPYAVYPRGLAADATAIYLVGHASGTLPGQTVPYGAFIQKSDFSGNLIWIRQFMYADARAVCSDSSGVYITGGSGTGFPAPEPHADQNSIDVYIRKYDFNGLEIWTHQFGTAGSDQGRSISCDMTGIYLAGTTTGTFPGQSRIGYEEDAFVRKYNSSGLEIWTRQFGTGSPDYALSASADDTAINVVGTTLGVFPGQISGGTYDIFIRRYGSNGDECWTNQFGSLTPAEDWAQAIDAYGNIYVTGYTRGVFPNQYGYGTEVLVSKFDISGNEIWRRQFGSSKSDYGYAICTDSSSVYVAGQALGALPGQAVSMGAFVRKYDSDGNELWTRQFEGDSAQGISLDDQGNVILAGYVTGVIPGQQSVGGRDAFLRIYDPTGTEVWTRQFGSASGDIANGVSADSSGIYVAGDLGGWSFVSKFDSSGNEVWRRQFGIPGYVSYARAIYTSLVGVCVAGTVGPGALPGQTASGQGDAYVRIYDPNGNELWTRQFGSTSYDIANAVTADLAGIYVAGTTLGALPGQSAAGYYDAFLRMYDALGNEVWTFQLGTSATDYGNAVSVEGSRVYLAGKTDGIFPGQDVVVGGDAFLVSISFNIPPVANAGSDKTLSVGEMALFNGSGSSDTDGTIVDYHWDFGDNTSASGVLVNHAYTAKGIYHGALTVTDDKGGTGRGYFTVTVSNSLPIAEAGPDIQALMGELVHFDGSQSHDPDGSIVRYQWDFGDGGTGEGPAPTHVYNDKVVWPVTLTVIDNEGATASDTLMVTVINAPPIAEAGESRSLTVNQSSTFDASGSSDPDGQIMGYSWDFGDGTTANGTTVTHAYSLKGPFTVTLTVSDNDGATTSDSLTVTVINSPPVANAGLDQTVEGTGVTTSFTLNGGLSSDPDGDAIVSYLWTDSGGNPVGSTATLTLSRALGSYAFFLTVEDTDYATSSDPVSITIRDTTPPAIVAPANLTVNESNPSGTVVNLGQPTVSDICDPTPIIVNNAPAFFALGDTVVTWKATDASGNFATAQQMVTVIPGPPLNQLGNLAQYIQYQVAAGGIEAEMETSLLAKVSGATDALLRGNANDAKVAMNELKALVSQVEAQTDNKIAPAVAAEIILRANRIISALGG